MSPAMKEPINWDAAAKYLAGEASAEEKAEVERWLAAQPSDAQVVEALDKALAHVKTPAVEVEAALRTVKARAADATTKQKRTRNIVVMVGAAAAAVAGIVFFSNNRFEL